MRAIALIILLTATIVSAQTTQPAFTLDMRGFVTDRTGKPIAGAQIDVFTGGDNYEPPRPFVKLGNTVADAEGNFVLKNVQKPSENAPHTIRATAPGMGFAYRSGPVVHPDERLDFGRPRGPGGADEAWLMLQPAEIVRGRVVDESGAPVVGAEILAELPIDPVRTNENGEFTIERCTPAVEKSDGNRILTIHHPDFVIDRVGQSRYSSNVSITLRRGVPVTGRLTELDSGAPVSGGVVRVEFEHTDNRPYYNQYHVWCDADGRYQLRLPTDLGIADLHPLAGMDNPTARRYEPTQEFDRIVTDTADQFESNFTFRQLVEIPAQPADRPPKPTTRRRGGFAPYEKLNLAGIRGRVLDEDGRPVPRARVEIVDLVTPFDMDGRRPFAKRPVSGQAMSDPTGNFRCRDIDSDQPLLLIAWNSTGERVGHITSVAGTREIELRLSERASTLSGVIRDESGKPVEGLPVELYIARESQQNLVIGLLTGVTDANGRYEIGGFRPLPEGVRAWLQVNSPQFNWTDGPSQRIAHQRTRYIHFPVKPGETLDGLDYDVLMRGERLPVPKREEFTREP